MNRNVVCSGGEGEISAVRSRAKQTPRTGGDASVRFIGRDMSHNRFAHRWAFVEAALLLVIAALAGFAGGANAIIIPVWLSSLAAFTMSDALRSLRLFRPDELSSDHWFYSFRTIRISS